MNERRRFVAGTCIGALIGGFTSGCTVMAVTDAAVSVATTTVKVAADVVGAGADVVRAGVKAVTPDHKEKKK